MKTLRALLLVLFCAAAAFGQMNAPNPATNYAPPCTGFDVNGVPVIVNSTNCTDYFGSPNWANSPLPASPITGFTIIAAGSGYVNPQVVITDPTGSGATATAVQTGGQITAVTVPVGGGGSGYVLPQITIVDVGAGGSVDVPTCGVTGRDACGSGALVTAVLGGPYTGGIQKFVDDLPDAKTLLATADKAAFAGSDYYEIALVQYTAKMHRDLPPTTLRGYVQVPTGSTGCTNALAAAANAHYLGPVILATKDVPVRVKFTNCLPTGQTGDLFIPTDTTYMGAGFGWDGTAMATYTQNRATLHLHGGASPWISDGTPHQWTVPAGENTTLAKGVSVAYVPDMFFDATGKVVCPEVQCASSGTTNDPGPGSLTFYWTNQQGARLMFYHDHAYGLTRLNVYAGEAAGYLLVDPAEDAKLAAAGAPGTLNDLAHLIPLVIQDKTFLPDVAQLNAQDPTWTPNFGTTPSNAHAGDLWFPHVYMPNQNPSDRSGASAFGRWDYGPWFLPPLTGLTGGTSDTYPCTSAAFPDQVIAPTPACPKCGCPIIPNPSGTPEAFMDTPIVNGKAYPVLQVAPEAYRFQILSAGNDRSLNLSWFIADASQNTPTFQNTEVAMLPAAPPSSGSPVPLCTTINPIAVPSLVLGLVSGLIDPLTGNPLNGTGLPSNCWPTYGQMPGIPDPQTMWAADGRKGGAPDPRNAGPAWIQIGSEGGLLPSPVVIPPTPVNYEQNVRSITIGSVAMHGLWLGPAERADVIVDFSQFAGKTLILYNDAPAPAPALDSRVDYFTGDGDQSPIGGAPNTPVGYGPNTRTIVKVIVGQTPTAAPFSLRALQSAFNATPSSPGVFASTQPTTIVPQAAYANAYGNPFPDVFMGVHDTQLTFTPLAPLTFDRPCTTNVPAAPAQCGELGNKTIQELFTLDYGRMNATLGTEIPTINFQNQTTLPFGYAEWPTEITQGGQTALWRITHNGVDSHFIHFHLFNVQVVNRVGWDGSIRPIDPNEAGWKDTVRMNPLEDILVALQPITPVVPFPLPDSIRSMDVTVAPGVSDTANMSGIDPLNGNPLPASGATNAPINFGWEYVWHCHILGHEENDMMRPIIHQVAPPVPGPLTATQPATGGFDLSWIDNSANEDSFTVQSSADPSFASPVEETADGTNTGVGTFNRKGYGQTVTFHSSAAGPYFRVKANDNFVQRSPLPSADTIFFPVVMSSGWSNVAAGTTLDPLVTFTGAPATAVYGASFTVAATSTSGAPPTITDTPGICAISNFVAGTDALATSTATVTMSSGTGVCTLTATWSATGTFHGTSKTQITTAALATPVVSLTGAPAGGFALYNTTFPVDSSNTSEPAVLPTFAGKANICTVAPLTATPTSATVTMISGAGICTVTASWPADTNYAAATQTISTNAGKAATTTALTVPAAASSGVPTTISFLVSPVVPLSAGAPGPSGSVTVTATSGEKCTGSLINGVGSCDITITPTGSNTLTGVYSNDRNFSASTSAATALYVGQNPGVSLTVPLTPVTYNATFTATAVTNSGVQANIVIVAGSVCTLASGPTYDGANTTTATYLMTAGTGTCSLSATWPANIRANFGPGATLQPATVTAAKMATTVSIIGTDIATATTGTPFNVQFTIAPANSPAALPGGSITVNAIDSGTENGSAPVTGWTGSVPLTLNAAGQRTFAATYSGDGNYDASLPSAPFTQPTLTTPTVTFTGLPTPTAPYLGTYTVTATSTAGIAPTIIGTANVCDVSNVAAATDSLATTTATVTMVSGSGTCVVTATWPQIGNFWGATKTQSTTATKIVSSVAFNPPLPTSQAYSSTFTVTVTTNGTTTAIPTIAGSGGCTGSATASTASLTMISGTNACSILVTWPEDPNYLGASLSGTVGATKLDTTIVINSNTPNPSVVGQPVIVSFTVTSATPLNGGATGPTGNASANASTTGESCLGTLASGTANCPLTFLTAVNRTITASYNGDLNFNPSAAPSAPVSQQVVDFSVITKPPAAVTVGGNQTARYTVTVGSVNGFTGQVSLTCGGTYPSTYTCTVTPTAFTLSAGGTRNVSVAVTTRRGSPGTYNVNVIGVSGTGVPATGGLTHNATPQMTVTTTN